MSKDRPGQPHGPIALRVEKVSSLFDPLDPFPLPFRDLARSAEEFIVSWAKELPRNEPVRLVLHIPASESRDLDLDQLRSALSNHFRQRSSRIRADLVELFQIGRRSLGIGVIVLAACVACSQLLAASLPAGPVASMVAQGLLIFGWVANWRPIEIFLYDWWPIDQRRRLYLGIAAAPIDIQID